MRGGVQFIVGGVSAALIMLSIITGLEVSTATARSGVEPSGKIVNRTQKGDRLPLVPALHLNAVNQPREIKVPSAPSYDSKLADGCESLVSPLAHSRLARIAGRCVS
jgi:hypothetical protein